MNTRLGFALRLLLAPPLLGGGAAWAGAADEAASYVALSGEPAKGRDLFLSKGCMQCHTVWGSGGKAGPDLTSVGMGRSFLQIAGTLWSHTPAMLERMSAEHVMPPQLAPKEMRDLIAYLYCLNYFNEPGDPELGQKVFEDKGCVQCHAIALRGGNVGPRLDTFRDNGSPLDVARAMWNHGPEMTAKMTKQGITPPTFKDKEMADLLAYIRGRPTGGIPEQRSTDLGDPASGKRLFSRKGCFKCHAVEGAGGTAAPDLASGDVHRSVTSLAGAMWNHGPAMWARMRQAGTSPPRLSKKEMADIVAYIYFAGYTDPPGDAAKGRDLFASKSCATCHTLGGDGDLPGPDLAGARIADSPLDFMTAMWNHAPQMRQLVSEKDLKWPKFEGDEMRDLVQYIRSAGRQSAGR